MDCCAPHPTHTSPQSPTNLTSVISLHYVLTGSCLSIWDSVGGKHTTERRLLLLDRSLFASKCCFRPVSSLHNVSSPHHRQEIWHEISLWKVSASVFFLLYRGTTMCPHHKAGNLARNLALESVIPKPLWRC